MYNKVNPLGFIPIDIIIQNVGFISLFYKKEK